MIREILLAVIGLSMVHGALAFGAGRGVSLLGCLDCFNFVAPSVLGAESVNPAEVGLIVYDANAHSFRGYTEFGGWSELSNNTKDLIQVSASMTVPAVSANILVDASSSVVLLSLPPASTMTARELTIKKTDSTSHSITIDPDGYERIDLALLMYLTRENQVLSIVSDGVMWKVLSSMTPGAIRTCAAKFGGSNDIADYPCTSNSCTTEWDDISSCFTGISRTATGKYSLTMSGYSSIPFCTGSVIRGGVAFGANVTSQFTVDIETSVNASGGGYVDAPFTITCLGY